MESMGRILEQLPPQTVKQWLESLRDNLQSTEADDIKMLNLLVRIGFPKANCVCGICYLNGSGIPVSIHALARQLLRVHQ